MSLGENVPLYGHLGPSSDSLLINGSFLSASLEWKTCNSADVHFLGTVGKDLGIAPVKVASACEIYLVYLHFLVHSTKFLQRCLVKHRETATLRMQEGAQAAGTGLMLCTNQSRV